MGVSLEGVILPGFSYAEIYAVRDYKLFYCGDFIGKIPYLNMHRNQADYNKITRRVKFL